MSEQDRNKWLEQAKEKVIFDGKQTDAAVRDILFLYDETAFEIEDRISALYSKFTTDNELSTRQAYQLISGKEYSVWRKSIEGFLEDISREDAGSKTLLELNTLAMKSRISREARLLSDVYRHIAQLAGDTSTKLEALLGDIVRTDYLRGSYNLQKGLQVGFKVGQISDNTVKALLDYPWAQKKFSKAVWDNLDAISALTRREITKGFISGASQQRMIQAIDGVMDRGKSAAERLVRTECKYFANQAELLSYKDNGITQYMYLGGTEGSVRCDCAEKSGNVYNVDEAKAGENFPPLHPNCLCTIKAHFEHSIFDDKRGAVPLEENIAFKEWQEKYAGGVEKGAKSDIMRDSRLQNIPITDAAIEKVPLVRPSGFSSKQAKLLRQRHQELLRFVQNQPPGKEAICYCDMKMNVITQYMGKGMSSVAGTPIAVPHIALHNHPSGMTFTHTDVERFARNDFICVLTAIGNDGAVYLLNKNKNYTPIPFLKYLFSWQSSHPELTDSVDSYLNAVKGLLEGAKEYGVEYLERRP